jgi:hypothetical protein
MKTLTKLTLSVTMLLASMTLCNAQVYYRGYQRHNGTYVQPHWQSSPDGNFYNNWSTYPNINPHTGRAGTLHTMPRGYGSGSNGLDVNDGLDLD